MATSAQPFKISKIEIVIREDPPEELDEGPKEVPMFDQTMSLLVMIKEMKVMISFGYRS